MKINDIIKEENKLDIVFDLDNTCILGFTVTPEKYKELKEKLPHKKLNLISFDFNGKSIF